MSQTIDPAILALEDIRNGSLAKTAQTGVPVVEQASEAPVNTTPVQPGGLFSGKSDGMADIKQTDADRSSAWDNIKGNKDLPMLGLMFGLNLLANSGKMDLGSALGQSGVATINAYNTHMKQRADRKYKLDSLAETKRMNNYTAKKMEDEATERLRIKGLNDRIAKGDRSAMWELDPMGMAKLEQQERMQRQAQGAAAANIRLQHSLALELEQKKRALAAEGLNRSIAFLSGGQPTSSGSETSAPPVVVGLDTADTVPGVTGAVSENTEQKASNMPAGINGLTQEIWDQMNPLDRKILTSSPATLASLDAANGTKFFESQKRMLDVLKSNSPEWQLNRDGTMRIDKRTGKVEPIEGSGPALAPAQVAQGVRDTGTARDMAKESSELLMSIDGLDKIVEGLSTGPMGKGTISDWWSSGKSVLGNDKDATAFQRLNQANTKWTLMARGGKDGNGGLTGATSDRDVNMLSRMAPGVDKTPEFNAYAVRLMQKKLTRDREIALARTKYLQEHGWLDPNWSAIEFSMLDKPIFSEAERKTAENLMRSTSESSGSSLPAGWTRGRRSGR